MRVKIKMEFEIEVFPNKQHWEEADKEAKQTYISTEVEDYLENSLEKMISESELTYEIIEED